MEEGIHSCYLQMEKYILRRTNQQENIRHVIRPEIASKNKKKTLIHKYRMVENNSLNNKSMHYHSSPAQRVTRIHNTRTSATPEELQYVFFIVQNYIQLLRDKMPIKRENSANEFQITLHYLRRVDPLADRTTFPSRHSMKTSKPNCHMSLASTAITMGSTELICSSVAREESLGGVGFSLGIAGLAPIYCWHTLAIAPKGATAREV